MVIERVRQTIGEHDLLREKGHVVVGVSGGPDSVCLLHVLRRLAPEWGLTLSAVHVNHGLRGTEADEDQRWTEGFCESLGIPCQSLVFDVAAQAREQGLTVEEAGRQLRYEAFARQREALIAGGLDPSSVTIAVAHNGDDQAETILMRILRGTGTYGLAGMEYRRQDGLIRPLLDVSRREIEAYCREQGLSPRRDSTNENPDYTRNRIRLELMPYLRENFNPGIADALNRLGRIAAEEKEWMDRQVQSALGKTPRLSLSSLRELAPALRKRVILQALKDAGLVQDVTAAHLAAAEQLILQGNTSDFLDLPGGYGLRLSYDRLEIIQKAGPRPSEAFRYSLCIGEDLRLPGTGDIIRTRFVDRETCRALGAQQEGNAERAPSDDSVETVFLSLDEILQETEGLEIRSRLPGDFIRPLGMKGTKKLQDYFVDRKIPRELRDRLPLLCLGHQVLWTPGRGLSEVCRVKTETEIVLLLEYCPGM